MPAWNRDAVAALAAAVGATIVDDDWGPGLATGTDALPPGAFVAPLSDLGLLSVWGAQAATFLHAQLTNDVEHLPAGAARWAGYCTAKGRLLSTLRYWVDTSGAIRLVLARPLAAQIARRLSMYVLRAKARVADASDAHAIVGLCGDAAGAAAARLLGAAPAGADGVVETSAPRAEGVVEAGASGVGAVPTLVGLPPMPDGSARPRWLLVVPAGDAARVWSALTETAPAVSSAAWRRTEVLAGIPRIVAGTSELFVPQMLNFESVDGVSFRKGCYPGQEIVARSQYLGKLKRRMFVAHGHGAVPRPGSDVFAASGGEPCGQVVLAAPDGAGGFDLLFESQVAAVEAGGLRAGDRPLSLGTLPYPLKSIE